MGHFNRKALVKHPLTFAIHMFQKYAQQKSNLFVTITLQGFGKSKTVTKKENFSMSEFIQKVEFNGQKYETPFPWKNNHELLPDNFLLAKNWLVSLVNHLKKDPIVLKTYDDIIKSEEVEGIIEEPRTTLKPPGEVHYLPPSPRYSTREIYN